MTYARTCYDHIAGKVGVEITASLTKNGVIEISGKGYCVTPFGNEWFPSIGINIEKLRSSRRLFASQCLDWSERKPHLAGALGAALLQVMLEKDWIRKRNNSRELLITPKGKLELNDLLKLDI